MTSETFPRSSPARLRSIWRSGGAVLGGWVMTHDPIVAEEMARCGFDEVVIDLQHGSVEIGHLANLFLAVSTGGAAPLVRTPAVDPVTIGRALDLGAAGVVVAMCETPEQAALVVASCRYAPTGVRSAGPLRAQYTIGSGDWDDLASVIASVIIETRGGVERIDEIAATPGLDAIYVGPGDLALSLGLPLGRPRSAEQERVLQDAVDRCLRAAQDAGIVPATHAPDGESAARLVQRGFRWVTVISEYGLIKAGGRRELGVAKERLGLG